MLSSPRSRRAALAWCVIIIAASSVSFLPEASVLRAEDSEASQDKGSAALLSPLKTLHDDLTRIEAKLNAFAEPRWEYKVLTPNVLGDSKFDPYNPNLDPLGRQGWELVTYSPDIGYILKRRIKHPSGAGQ